MGAGSAEIAGIAVEQRFEELFQAGLPGELAFEGRRGVFELVVA